MVQSPDDGARRSGRGMKLVAGPKQAPMPMARVARSSTVAATSHFGSTLPFVWPKGRDNARAVAFFLKFAFTTWSRTLRNDFAVVVNCRWPLVFVRSRFLPLYRQGRRDQGR